MTWLDGIDPESIKDVLAESYHVLSEESQGQATSYASIQEGRVFNWEEDCEDWF
jgi:hypothetical protein